jgi:hypothetical protein
VDGTLCDFSLVSATCSATRTACHRNSLPRSVPRLRSATLGATSRLNVFDGF